MSNDDEHDEGWDPEDDKIDDKFKKAITRYMEKMMDELDRAGKPQRVPQAPPRRGRVVDIAHYAPPLGDCIGVGYAPPLAEPMVTLRKISNGWVVGSYGAKGMVEIFATTDGIGQIAHDVCVEAEKQYEQSKKLIEEMNKGTEGGFGIAP